MSIDYQELTGKLITENGDLKNELSHAVQELNDLYYLVEQYPNNMDLGEKFRQSYWENTTGENERSDEWVVDQYNRNRAPEDHITKPSEMPEPPVWGDSSITRDNLEERLNYLNTELAHSDKWDGWSIKGMKEEKQWIESKINEESNNQLELFNDNTLHRR